MQEHSEAYLHIMENRKRREELRKRRISDAVKMVLIVAVIAAGIMTCMAACKMNQAYTVVEAAEPQVMKVEVITLLSEDASEQPSVVHADAYESYLLAKIAMAEAESEDTICKALVIRTVLNRVESNGFPDTISEVIFQENQFTPVSNGRFDRVEPDEDCYAALALVRNGWDESHGALYFEITTDEDTWHSENLVKLYEHGVTSFYTEEPGE